MPTSIDWSRLFEQPDTLYVLLSVVAILAGATTIVMLAKFLIAHRERMALIKRGIHPDYPPHDVDVK